MIGIVKAVAKSFFDLEVDMKIRKCEELNEKLSFHCVFDIETKEMCRSEKCMERKLGYWYGHRVHYERGEGGGGGE